MKRVTIFVGSARKKHTYQGAQAFADQLATPGEIETEVVFLHNYNLKPCLGCLRCFEKGEEHCPLSDDRDILLEKIRVSDGVVFATPNYSFQVSGLLKVFLDRFGFMFHRPRYFEKTYTSIVTQGIFGGASIVKYLDFIGRGLGCKTTRGVCLATMEPLSSRVCERNNRKIERLTSHFRKLLLSTKKQNPSLLRLIMFRVSRTGMHNMLDDSSCDFRYFDSKSWFSSDYYYPVKLGLFKKIIGRLVDYLSSRKYSQTTEIVSTKS